MEKPVANDIRSWSDVDWVKLGKPVPTGAGDPDPLTVEIDRAVVYLHGVTGREISNIAENTDDATRFNEATQLRVEQQVFQKKHGYLADLYSDAVDLSVEGYSTKRIAASERMPKNMVNPHPRLNELIMALATDEKLAEYNEAFGDGDTDAAVFITYPDWG